MCHHSYPINYSPSCSMTQDLPIKDHLANLSTTIGEIKGAVAQQSKELQSLMEELSIVEYKLQDPFKDNRDYFQVSKAAILHHFDKECGIFEEEVGFLKEQIDSITEDKLKIIQTSLKVNAKLREISQDVGIEPPEMFMI